MSFSSSGSIQWEKDYIYEYLGAEYGTYDLAITDENMLVLGVEYFFQEKVDDDDDDDDDDNDNDDDDNDDNNHNSNNDDDDNDDSGCAVGKTDPAVPLIAVMLLIGLVAMAVSLRRK